MKNRLTIAKRYALAFLNVFPINSEVFEKIKQVIKFLNRHDEVFLMLKIPLLEAKKKSEALEDYLIKQFKLPETFKELISVLIAHKRSYMIKDILRWMVELYEERAGIEFFEVRSSVPLDANDISTIEQFLADKTNHSISIKQMLDDELIAGIRLQSIYHLWEYSIASQLCIVQRQLKE
jgi:F-type H+-transporting ATPase subunit delta